MDKKELVAIYLRKSRSDEGVEALRNHKAVLTRLADSKGFTYEIYEEIGSSVSLDARDKLNALLDDIHKYSRILVMDLDRLARSIAIMEEIKQKLRYNNVKILTPNQEIDLTNESNELMMDFQSVIAKAEYQQIRKRMQIGKIEGARAGRWVAGNAPLGYTYDRNTKRLRINEEEAETVRLLYKLALENKSYTEIAVAMNVRGYRSKKGSSFIAGSVSVILKNEAYIGTVTFRQKSNIRDIEDTVIKTPNSHPAIISEADFLEVQRLIYNRRSYTGSLKSVTRSMLQGIVYCGFCGKRVSISNRLEKEGQLYIGKCKTVDSYGQGCPNRSMQMDKLEAVIYEALGGYKEQVKAKVMDMMAKEVGGSQGLLQQELEGKLKKVESSKSTIKRLLDLYLDAEIDKDTFSKKKREKEEVIKHLEDDVRRIQLQLMSLNPEAQTDRLNKVLEVLDNIKDIPVEEARRMLQTIVKKVTLKIAPDESSVYRRAKLEPEVTIEWHK